SPDAPPETARVMITAHGAADSVIAGLRARGLQVEEATCPLVRHAHRSLRRLVAEGYFPVVIGRPDHVEVRPRRRPGGICCGPERGGGGPPGRPPAARDREPDDAAARLRARPRGADPRRLPRGGGLLPRHRLPADEGAAGGGAASRRAL